MSILTSPPLKKRRSGLIEPSDILNHTRKTIIERLKKDGSIEGGKDGMDASWSVLILKKCVLTHSAANNPVWIVRQQQLIELSPDKMPVGKHDRIMYLSLNTDTVTEKWSYLYSNVMVFQINLADP